MSQFPWSRLYKLNERQLSEGLWYEGASGITVNRIEKKWHYVHSVLMPLRKRKRH